MLLSNLQSQNTCDFHDITYSTVFHVSACFSFPIYGLSLYVLFSNCPNFFKQYRVLLLRHIFSNVLNDIIATVIWLPRFYFPGMISCSLGIFKNFNVAAFISFVTSLALIGISLIHLFHHILKTVTFQQLKCALFAKIFKQLLFLIHIMYLVDVLFLFFTYNDLQHQNDYKLSIYESGKVPNVIFCSTCFVPNFKSQIVKMLFGLGIVNIILTSILIFTMALITFISLHRSNQSKSVKTLSLQRNFLNILILQISVHFGCLSAPLIIFFAAVYFNIPSLPARVYDASFFIATQHGTLATATFILTNKLLFSALKEKLGKLIRCQNYQPTMMVSSTSDRILNRRSTIVQGI